MDGCKLYRQVKICVFLKPIMYTPVHAPGNVLNLADYKVTNTIACTVEGTVPVCLSVYDMANDVSMK